MLKNDIKKLDIMVQKLAIGAPCKICGQPSSVMHHIVSRTYLAVRYWKPNLMPLCHFDHYEIHNGHKKIEVPKELQQRTNIIAKNIRYQDVVDYLNSIADDYLPS